MGRNIDDFVRTLPSSRRKKIERRAEELIAEEMTLQELRKAQKRTQVELAKTLGIAQKQISKIEERTDMHISTLRRQVEAMGGTLELVARFPNRAPVSLSGLEQISGRKRRSQSQKTERSSRAKLRA